MGFFKDIKKMQEQGAEMQKESLQMQQQMMQQYVTPESMQAAATAQAVNQAVPYAEDAPEVQPVNGISLRQYAQICAATQNLGTDEDARAQYAESQGIASATWKTTSSVWSDRIVSDPRLNKTFNLYWRQASGLA